MLPVHHNTSFKMFSSLILLQLLLIAAANSLSYTYSRQQNWPGICVSGHTGRQSPIAIRAEYAWVDPELVKLSFNSAWTTAANGKLSNTGHGVQFLPTIGSPQATVRTHLGDYDFHQVHMHWGSSNDQGSEHTVDGLPYSLEIHFVLTKRGSVDKNARDHHAVVAVFADVDANMDIRGAWAQLNASTVPEFPSSSDVVDFTYSHLLPKTRDYYYYQGSLTTPPCNETVQWFVIKEPIPVPADYLTQLRQVQSAHGNEPLTFNFRNVQDLNQRIVYTNRKGHHCIKRKIYICH